MAEAIAITTMAGAVLSAYGAVQHADAAKKAAFYNADLNTRNATIAYDQASAEAAMVRRQAAQVQGSAVAGYGASGVQLEGSPLDVLASSAAQAKLDEETVNYRGNLKAMGYYSNAELDRMAGTTAVQQGQLQAASSFLTGVGNAGSYYTYAGKGASTSNSPAAQRQALGAR